MAWNRLNRNKNIQKRKFLFFFRRRRSEKKAIERINGVRFLRICCPRNEYRRVFIEKLTPNTRYRLINESPVKMQNNWWLYPKSGNSYCLKSFVDANKAKYKFLLNFMSSVHQWLRSKCVPISTGCFSMGPAIVNHVMIFALLLTVAVRWCGRKTKNIIQHNFMIIGYERAGRNQNGLTSGIANHFSIHGVQIIFGFSSFCATKNPLHHDSFDWECVCKPFFLSLFLSISQDFDAAIETCTLLTHSIDEPTGFSFNIKMRKMLQFHRFYPVNCDDFLRWFCFFQFIARLLHLFVPVCIFNAFVLT